MKTKLFNSILVFFAVIGIFSCKKSSIDPVVSNVTFTATLNGASESAANASASTGTASFSYNPTTYVLSGIVTYSGLTATAAHIHKGAVGVAGDVVFSLGSTLTSPITFTSIALTTAQQSDLLANLYYVNIHSTLFPGGEIRGQLLKQGSVGTGGAGGGTGGY
jgi:hypothetical protein